jgi:serine protease Do
MFLASGLVALGIGVGWQVHSLAPHAAQAETFGDVLTVEERSRLYDHLEQQVAALEQQGNVLKTVVKLVSPTVVHIEAKKRSESRSRNGRVQSVDEAGSGVVISYNGKQYVLTNRHVIKDAALEDVTVHINDGREFHPTTVWSDPDTDIAVVALPATELFAARLGDSDAVQIGDFVLAVGSPFGLSHSVTYGIISAKGRRDLQLGDDGVRFQDFMQTDAAINPGNSGGPLLNLRGEVIGINTAIASNSGGNEGIGFTIPVNMVMVIAKQLIEHGVVSRAFLGVQLDSRFGPTMAAQLGLPRVTGARITSITPNSPAAEAQLRKDDVILEFRGVRIEDDNHLVNLVSLTEVEREVPVVVYRERRTVTIMVKVGDRKKFEQQRSQAPQRGDTPAELGARHVEVWDIDELGVSVVSLNPAVASTLNVAISTRGLMITDVNPQGPAAGQLTVGEIIDAIDQVPIRDISDLDSLLEVADSTHPLQLRLLPKDSSGPAARIVLLTPALGKAR